MDSTVIISALLGLGLSSAVGFRIFLPALITSLAGYTGNLQLSEGMEWMASTPALIIFSVATVVEVVAFYIPFVDNLLDAIATPLAVACGSMLMGSTIIEMEPMIRWPIAVIAGGGMAGAIQSGTSLIRLKSSGLTGGLGNSTIATAEFGIAGVLSIISIVFPILAGILVLYIIYKIVRRKIRI